MVSCAGRCGTEDWETKPPLILPIVLLATFVDVGEERCTLFWAHTLSQSNTTALSSQFKRWHKPTLPHSSLFTTKQHCLNWIYTTDSIEGRMNTSRSETNHASYISTKSHSLYKPVPTPVRTPIHAEMSCKRSGDSSGQRRREQQSGEDRRIRHEHSPNVQSHMNWMCMCGFKYIYSEKKSIIKEARRSGYFWNPISSARADANANAKI